MNPDANAAPREQYEAFQAGRGVIELTNWTSVAVTGADRVAFLHNFCTNDIKRLSTGERCETFFTNVKGKTIGHGLVSCRENELIVIGEPEQASPLVAHLDRYIIREDVQLRDDTAERSYLLVRSQKVSAHRLDFAAYISDWYAAQGSSFQLFEVQGSDLRKLKEKLAASDMMNCDRAFEIVRIEGGIPLFGVDFDERNFPQEVGRNNNAISFTKGCYLGQETVARIDALGHVNQQLVGAQFSGEVVPEKGTQLTHVGKAVGQVTSAVFSLKLQAALALAMVRREQSSIGTRLDSPIGPCEIVSLPV